MNGDARTAIGLLLAVSSSTACGGTSPHTAAGDASSEATGAISDARAALGDVADAPTTEGPDGDEDAAPEAAAGSEGGVAPDCATQSVPPSTLACTGLYADLATKTIAAGVRPYQPAVPLWSDNAQKARWIRLPPGTRIDAANPEEWTFPVGTTFWKEFSTDGKRIETRMFQKVEAGPPPIWVHTTYAWNADESAALVSGGGDIPFGQDGGTYHIPTFSECEKCHNGRTDHVLGFEQVMLGLPQARGLTLTELAAGGLIAPVPSPVILGDDGTGAAADPLSWLHVNCGVTCHNGNSSATAFGVGMRLRLDPRLLDGRPITTSTFDPLATTLGVPANSPGWVPGHWARIVPGDPSRSLLVQLISNRGRNNPVGGQMPPIATSIVDVDDVAKVVEWIRKMPGAPLNDGGSDSGGGADFEGGADATLDDAGSDATIEASVYGEPSGG